jgi:desulfoferrodoxin (superoxide reductase-like protein)
VSTSAARANVVIKCGSCGVPIVRSHHITWVHVDTGEFWSEAGILGRHGASISNPLAWVEVISDPSKRNAARERFGF